MTIHKYHYLVLPLIGLTALSSCESMEEVKSNFAKLSSPITDNLPRRQNGHNQAENTVTCPNFQIVEDLDTYYEIPETKETQDNVGFATASLSEISGQCRESDSKLVMNIDVEFTATPGPFSKVNEGEVPALNVPYFIAVVDNDEAILAKDKFDVTFDLGKEEADLYHRETLEQIIPLSDDVKPESYDIMVGFQLDERQLDYARQQQAIQSLPAAGDEENPDPLAKTEEKVNVSQNR